jgi:hypothetical protein
MDNPKGPTLRLQRVLPERKRVLALEEFVISTDLAQRERHFQEALNKIMKAPVPSENEDLLGRFADGIGLRGVPVTTLAISGGSVIVLGALAGWAIWAVNAQDEGGSGADPAVDQGRRIVTLGY